MSQITLPVTLANNTVADANDVMSNFNTVVNDYNGSISNTNISGSAAIAESKLLFAASGHGHSGGTDGKQIQLRRYVSNFSRDTSVASGTQAVTGVGFTPQVLFLLQANDNGSDDVFSVGFSTVTTDHCLQSPPAGGSGANYEVNTSTGRSIYFETSSGNSYVGEITSFDSDGFTVNWTQTGAPSGTIRIAFLALALTAG